MAALRLNENDTVGRVRAVNRGRRRVAEYRYGLDVVRIDEVQRVATRGKSASRPARDAQRHAVDHVERLAARIERSGSADADRHSPARLVVVHHLHTGDLALNELLRTDQATTVERRRIHLRDGSGDVAGSLLSVADHDDLGQANRLWCHRQIGVDCLSVSHGHIARGGSVPDNPRSHGMRAGGDAGDHEATVRLRQGAAAFDCDGHAGNGLSCGGVSDASADGTGGCLLRVQRRNTNQ